MQNKIIEKWSFKASRGKEQNGGERRQRDRERISRTLNRNKYAAARIRVYTRTRMCVHHERGFRATIN